MASSIAITLAESALTDIEEIREWYAENGATEAGSKFVLNLFERIETLATHPDLGRIVPEFNQPSLRELIHSPYRVVYRREKNRVRIVRIWRNERRLQPPSD